MLEAAIHAPNHHRTEPWQFFVLVGKARIELGLIMEQSLRESLGETETETARFRLQKERQKPLRSPAIIVVASEHPTQPGVIDIENVEATAAAVQNMLLTAEEMGLACIWRTGEAAYDPRVKRWLGLTLEDHIVAVLYVGYPASTAQERHPKPIESKTAWLGWEE
jgi:nitroreductase